MNLYELAKDNGLTHVETTSEGNGYPSGIKSAIIGFESFGEAQDFAAKHNLSLELIERRNGWGLWYRPGNTAYDAIKVDPEDFGADFRGILPGQYKDEKDFIQQEVMPKLQEEADFDDLHKTISNMYRLWEHIEDMDNDEIILTNGGYYYDKLQQKTCHYHYDNKHFAIAAV